MEYILWILAWLVCGAGALVWEMMSERDMKEVRVSRAIAFVMLGPIALCVVAIGMVWSSLEDRWFRNPFSDKENR